MHRLFVALRPPPPARLALGNLMDGLAGARWQSDEQLHLTLRFIGLVDRHQGEDVVAALSAVRHPPIRACLGAIGSFNRRGRIDTVWVGVMPVDPIAALHRKVDQALVRAGLSPEGRAFVPHITIARFGRAGPDTSALARYASALPPLPSTLFEMDAFTLFESHLGAEGASYEPIERWRLG